MCNVTHSLFVIMKRCDETAFHKMCDITHPLFVIGKMWWDCLSQTVQCHSTICWWNRCNETAFHKMCKCHPPQQAVSHRKRCDQTPFHKMWNITHFLLVIRKMWSNCFHKHLQHCLHPVSHGGKIHRIMFQTNLQSYSHTAGHWQKFDNVIEILDPHDMLLTFYVYRKRSDFTAFTISLTIWGKKNVSKLSCSRVASITHFLLGWN